MYFKQRRLVHHSLAISLVAALLVGCGGGASLEASDSALSIAGSPMSDSSPTVLQGHSGAAYRMYQAAFDRAPDEQGLNFYVDQLSSGKMTLKGMAAGFFNSPEFKSRYGSAVTSSDFVNLLYKNVLGRAPDAAGLQFHKSNLDGRRLDFSDTLVSFAESPENVQRVSGNLTKVIDIAAGGSMGVVVRQDGSLWSWGAGGYVGDGTPYRTVSPVKIGTGFASADAGGSHSVAIKKDGSLWAWGSNERGQLGNGSIKEALRPVQVGTGFAAASAGSLRTVAIKTDGSLWSWGDGPVGDGANVLYQSKPVQIGTDFVAADAAGGVSAGLKKDGSVWVWGRLYAPGVSSFIEKPRRIVDSGAVAIAAFGGCFGGVFFVKADGSLWVWSANDCNLGDGGGLNKERSSPITKIGDNFSSVYADESAVVYGGIKKDGSVWTWGLNFEFGKLGNGSIAPSPTPVRVAEDAAQLAIGLYTTILKKDGSVHVAGGGVLEPGITLRSPTPQRVPPPVEDGKNDSLSATYVSSGAPAEPPGGTGGTGGTGSSGGTGTGVSCNNLSYAGPKNDVQAYVFDAAAQLRNCQFASTGDQRFLTLANQTCLQLRSFLDSVSSPFKPLYCSGSQSNRKY